MTEKQTKPTTATHEPNNTTTENAKKTMKRDGPRHEKTAVSGVERRKSPNSAGAHNDKTEIRVCASHKAPIELILNESLADKTAGHEIPKPDPHQE